MPTSGNNSSQVLSGSAALYLAPSGTAAPPLDGTAVTPATLNAAFVNPGYTDKGVDLSYAPSFKDFNVDEELAPVARLLSAEKATISCILSQATLINLNLAIAASSKNLITKDPTHYGATVLHIGSGTPVENVLVMFGTSPVGLSRILVATRATATANVKMAFQRAGQLLIPIEFTLLADSALPVGQRLFNVLDQTVIPG